MGLLSPRVLPYTLYPSLVPLGPDELGARIILVKDIQYIGLP